MPVYLLINAQELKEALNALALRPAYDNKMLRSVEPDRSIDSLSL